MDARLHLESLHALAGPPVGLLVVEHVAQLGRHDAALQAAEKLVSASSCAVMHKVFHEAKVARVVSKSVANAGLDRVAAWSALDFAVVAAAVIFLCFVLASG